jgi:DNA mismatch repair protein MutS2
MSETADLASLPNFALPERADRDLGFALVRERIAAACKTPMGLEAAQRAGFPKTRAALERRLTAAREAQALHEAGAVLDFAPVLDLRPVLAAIEKDATLGALDILDVARTLEAMARLSDLIQARADDAPGLAQRASRLSDERAFVRRLLRTFDEEGNLTDDASPSLKGLRDRVRELRKEASTKLEDLIRGFDDKDILRDRNFTVRNDRYCLPVISGFQHRVDGIVHDASQTGATVFIEPRALLEIGNRIMIAKAGISEEEARILRELTGDIAARASGIEDDLRVVAELEADFARGRLAADIHATRPEIAEDVDDGFELYDARHPALAWRKTDAERAEQPGEEVIANDLFLTAKRALVISGPNAGGKTVALKTAGLCAVMARAGLPIPAAEGSRVPLFSAVVATVGDAQDLERGLSSFSGHLEALREIFADTKDRARGEVLALLDEIAAGTDPTQGAALAQAVLEELVERGARVVATTHYERLKLLGIEDARFENASVGTDTKTGQPTYHVHLGQVGTSDAFEAARRSGIDESVLERAASVLRPDERGVQEMLRGLEEQSQRLQAERAELADKMRKIDGEREHLKRRLEEAEQEARRLRREGARAFAGEIADARKAVADAIERVQQGADARELNEISHQLKDAERAATEASRAPEAAPELVVEVKPGDKVRVASFSGAEVEVLSVDGEKVQVARGAMKMWVEIAELREAPRAKKSGGKPRASKRGSSASSSKDPRTSTNTLDVRGERLSDALELMDAFLDDLMRKGRARGFILHGHGTGALKRGLRDAMKQSRYVRRFDAADPEDGGDAFTVVDLAEGGV